jgi:16S rRNA (cytosine1402-N4)-methyltransferase
VTSPEPAHRHVPVLLEAVVDRLLPLGRGAPPRVIVDCTAGLGGHAVAMVRRALQRRALDQRVLDQQEAALPSAPAPPSSDAPRAAGDPGAPGEPGAAVARDLTAVLFDLDPGNLRCATEAVRRALAAGAPEDAGESAGRRAVIAHHANFAEAPRRLAEAGLRADVVLADLGFASNQVDDAARGLSFSRDGPLDMRLDPGAPFSAADLVASASAEELERLIRDYGEERCARSVARRIVEARRQAPIRTTGRLAEIVRSAIPNSAPRGGGKGIDPATRTFQALRIAVNDELGNLSALLDAVERAAQAVHRGDRTAWLAPGAAVGIISFHSLEDRPVKQAFQRLVAAGLAVDLTPGPVIPGEAECRANPRSRSAKFRAVRLARG